MSKKTEKIAFEDALERLEALLESMENGDTPLAELIAKFEEGSALLKTCQKKLHEAELKIEKLNLQTGEFSDFDTQKVTTDLQTAHASD